MRTISNYISEKLHLKKDNDSLNANGIEMFIDSFDVKVRPRVISLVKMCLHELTRHTQEENHECYITRNECLCWSINKANEHLNVGDKTRHGGTVLYVFKKGDTLPKKYLEK